MNIKHPRFNRADVDITEQKSLFSGFFTLLKIRLRHRLFSGEWSPPIERELFSKASAAAAIAYDPVMDKIGLVEQFRVGMLEAAHGPWSLEAVAGMLEPDETPEKLIARELVEEAGLEAKHLIPITGFYPTPGSCNEYTHLFCAICDLSQAGGVFGLVDEGEDILFNVYSAEEVFDAMLQSRMNNATTLIGLQWLERERDPLRAQYPNWETSK